jgi:hypothetical protein
MFDKGTQIELIPVNLQVDEILEAYYTWNNSIVVDVDNLTVTEISFPIGNKNILTLKTVNELNEEIPINNCLLKGNHLLATHISLFDGDVNPNFNQLGVENVSKMELFGEVKLLEGSIVIKEKSEVVQHLWNKYEKKLEGKEKDFRDLEELYSGRLEDEREMYQQVIEDLQNKLRELTQQNVFQQIEFENELTDFLSESIITKIRRDKMTTKELSKAMGKVNKNLKKKVNP